MTMKTKIIIGGKEYPCRVTMGALLRFKRETGHDVRAERVQGRRCGVWADP